MFEPQNIYPQLHMMFMHFPIALFIVGFIFDLLAYALKKDQLINYGLLNMGLGIFFGLITVTTGLLADWYVNEGDWSIGYGFIANITFLNIKILGNHGIYMILCLSLFIILFFIKIKNKEIQNKIINISILVFHLIVILILTYGSHLGTLL